MVVLNFFKILDTFYVRLLKACVNNENYNITSVFRYLVYESCHLTGNSFGAYSNMAFASNDP